MPATLLGLRAKIVEHFQRLFFRCIGQMQEQQNRLGHIATILVAASTALRDTNFRPKIGLVHSEFLTENVGCFTFGDEQFGCLNGF